MKVAVIGSRTFDDYDYLKSILDKGKTKITAIVSGGAKGADKLSERWADENDKEKLIFLPDWEKYKKAGGFIRNQDIIKNCDKVIAFWDGKSKGTKHSIDLAKKLGKPILIKYF